MEIMIRSSLATVNLALLQLLLMALEVDASPSCHGVLLASGDERVKFGLSDFSKPLADVLLGVVIGKGVGEGAEDFCDSWLGNQGKSKAGVFVCVCAALLAGRHYE